mmetsp:Transcript_14331/g.21228  ORF Transcript_14331/g.21228 Transcript_14331/m.21228 type:complete len:704 (+) Transcript_14331:66-2177(+)|eukprot:CAMPEP_0171464024 /NCGR_PEP_ID=MMETSP0945-20130129/7475_1 /TAXON_ID=109269 /ORGANISM="Vaucheria litorea, Strain CCMP2940" /LENGTH=703 /DNA_ID=CAMNT_0011990963 /DNA_START=45 /DNA_END=2156 /DNA_ORIENTATION=-
MKTPFACFCLALCILSTSAKETCQNFDTPLKISQNEPITDLYAAGTTYLYQKLSGITWFDIEIEGDSTGTIGTYTMRANVFLKETSPEGEEKGKQDCFFIPYEITDVDECSLNPGDPWFHNCHPSTGCRNTIGSFECDCNAHSWGVRGSGSTYPEYEYRDPKDEICGGKMSTEECCSSLPCLGSPQFCIKNCKSNFRCTSDPCKEVNCPSNSTCKRTSDNEPLISGKSNYESYKCQCNEGFDLFNGMCIKTVNRACERGNNNCPLNCNCMPVGKYNYQCISPPGYTPILGETVKENGIYTRLDDIVQCRSDRSNQIELKGPSTVYYKQGDTYKENGVKIIGHDDTSGEGKLRVENSADFGAYFKNVGTFYVSYTWEAPLDGRGERTELPLKARREVIVSDVDECTYKGPVDFLKHKCSPDAICMNTVGSYECKCPKGYEGDGLLYGSGCTDVTPPTIKCRGKACNVQLLRASNCVGLITEDNNHRFMLDQDENFFESARFQEAIVNLEKEMCDGSENACFVANDYSPSGLKDVSSRIVKGPLEKLSEDGTMWRIAYYATDEAGNVSETVYLNLKVEMVDVLSKLNDIVIQGGSFRKIPFLYQAIIVTLAIISAIAIISIAKTLIDALKCVLNPMSFIGHKEEFDMAYDLVLRVSSMNMMSATERKYSTAVKWAELHDNLGNRDFLYETNSHNGGLYLNSIGTG